MIMKHLFGRVKMKKWEESLNHCKIYFFILFSE